MTTVHGVKMSPRMERLWHFLRNERQIDLTDWSTDECVERKQSELRAAVEEAKKRAMSGRREDAELLRDVETIANRRPHVRTHEAMVESERQALAARGVQAGADLGDEAVSAIRRY